MWEYYVSFRKLEVTLDKQDQFISLDKNKDRPILLEYV